MILIEFCNVYTLLAARKTKTRLRAGFISAEGENRTPDQGLMSPLLYR